MTAPNQLGSSAFLIDPRNRPVAEGKTKTLPMVREFPVVAASALALSSLGFGASAYKHWQRGEQGTSAGLSATIFSALSLAGAAYIAWLQGGLLLRAWRLRRRGQLMAGEVIFCAGTRTELGDLVVNMKYRFPTPDGRVIEAVERFGGQRLPGETLPSPKTTVAVFYAADDCYVVL